MAKYDVTADRHEWLGGSDISAIMGISSFVTRYQLLLDKAEITPLEHVDNEYVEYGKTMEPIIRGYIESVYKTKFEEDEVYKGHVRYHSDGFDSNTVLEIKTTSQTHDDIHGYRVYLVQLLTGMWVHDVESGILAVYDRPEDFSTEFDEKRLQVFEVKMSDHKAEMERILNAIDVFWTDLEFLRENPLAFESELPSSNALVPIAERAVELESYIRSLKSAEQELKDLKAELKVQMEKHSIKGFTMPDGTKVTLVLDGQDKEVKEFDESRFKEDHKDLYEKYQTTKIKKGRAGYVRIT